MFSLGGAIGVWAAPSAGAVLGAGIAVAGWGLAVSGGAMKRGVPRWPHAFMAEARTAELPALLVTLAYYGAGLAFLAGFVRLWTAGPR
ncbi:MAG TPA: hypothetical protein VFP72_24670 [Kineosporiaceae bacterium]|nr:hypothetical protein [Kineosporiaceae bacterium]